MRPTFLLALLAVILAVVGGIVLFKRETTRPAPVVATVATPTPPATVSASATPAPSAQPPELVVTQPPETPEEHQAAIDAEVNRLYELSYKSDAASLAAIEADLTSPEKEIRLAAIEAAKQFDDTNAIPVLKADAASSQNMDEQIAMLQAAQFLAIPDADLTATNSNPIPATPDQIQAAQQKFAAIQAKRQAIAQRRSGSFQTAAPSASPNDQPAAPGN